MAYIGPVARIREEMERERAAFALTGEAPAEPGDCPILARVLRARLLTAWVLDTESAMVLGHKSRPWRLGTDMVGPVYFWQGVARVVNHPSEREMLQIWTRKAHRAWRCELLLTSGVAAAIFRGEVKDAFSW